MGAITTLTRMWLTRSTRPFIFKNEYDERLKYGGCNKLGLYVHIPFCRSICDFCPYCKEIYDKNKCEKYINALLKEIDLVGRGRKNKKQVTSLYFGGGTPALAYKYIKTIIERLEKYFIITEGIGVELHPDNVTDEVLSALQAAGVTKLSIGIQSFQPKFSKMLGRKPADISKISAVLKKYSFETVSMDFIFALPSQTLDDLKADIDTAFAGGANHIAIYPFIDFTFTKSRIKAMPKRDKRRLLNDITDYLEKSGCHRDSIWTFSNTPEARYSSMTRENFLGFGCSATTLLRRQFKINTFSADEYIKRVEQGRLPTSLTLRFTLFQRMIYYLFWTAYSTKVDSRDFEDFFGIPLKEVYGFEIFILKLFGFIAEENGVFALTKKGAFYYHHYENYYTLAYIDKMWNIMGTQAFPQQIIL